MLRLGIRSKEFYNDGKINSDATPFDTDFSELVEENIKENLDATISSTYSGFGYGNTFYVIKKEDYSEEQSYTGFDNSTNKTRYFRTSIGNNRISYILTKEWKPEYAYVFAQNGIFIPVIDITSQEVVFDSNMYNQIREKMRGLSFYRTDEFLVDTNTENNVISQKAEELRKKAEGKTSTEEKREKLVKQMTRNIDKSVTDEITGDLSRDVIELIDTGSTGRGTNIPGDGDFDFMLKCADADKKDMIANIKKVIPGKDKGGTDEYNIRYENVKVDGLSEELEVDVTTATKTLKIEYSSDSAVRDRLDSIRKKYGEEVLKTVVDNIIVAKKALKSEGVYKGKDSTGCTEYGGLGGIGVENWILQNGGSFIVAMQTGVRIDIWTHFMRGCIIELCTPI